MEDIKCGTCTQCCEWGDDKSIRPILSNDEVDDYRHIYNADTESWRLEATPAGNCIYMRVELVGEKGGCRIHHKRPDQCRGFDCRSLYEQMKSKTFIKVIIKGAVMSA